MFDLSPEKIMALLAVGMVVLGPHRLPMAARSLAQGLSKARRLAATLTEPVQASLAEPRQHLERAVQDVRGAVQAPGQAMTASWSAALRPQPTVVGAPTSPSGEAHPDLSAGFSAGFDPTEN